VTERELGQVPLQVLVANAVVRETRYQVEVAPNDATVRSDDLPRQNRVVHLDCELCRSRPRERKHSDPKSGIRYCESLEELHRRVTLSSAGASKDPGTQCRVVLTKACCCWFRVTIHFPTLNAAVDSVDTARERESERQDLSTQTLIPSDVYSCQFPPFDLMECSERGVRLCTEVQTLRYLCARCS